MFKEQTFLYEILYRGGPDGFQGAHAIDLRRVSDGDRVLIDEPQPARPITETEFAALIGGEAAKLIEAADAARAQIALAKDEAAKQIAEATALADAAESRAAELERALAASEARVEALTSAAATAAEAREGLEVRLQKVEAAVASAAEPV